MQFYLDILVNGARVPFLVDTGASSVVLTKEAARRARINPNRLDYTQRAHTANGTAGCCPSPGCLDPDGRCGDNLVHHQAGRLG